MLCVVVVVVVGFVVVVVVAVAFVDVVVVVVAVVSSLTDGAGDCCVVRNRLGAYTNVHAAAIFCRTPGRFLQLPTGPRKPPCTHIRQSAPN